MTRDGAVTENLATGEVRSISEREAEIDYSAREPATAAKEAGERAAAVSRRRTAKKAAKAEADTIREGEAVRQRPFSRPELTESERGDPRLKKYVRRSERAADKLETAKRAVPTKKRLTTERVFDEATGKGKTRLAFESVEEKPNGRLRQTPLSRPAYEAKSAIHKKVYEVEHENVGVEAGHRGELLAEHGIVRAGQKTRSMLRARRMKPWRDAIKAENAAIRAEAELIYQKALLDDPALAASNPVSRYLQKKRIQRNAAKKLRETEKAAKETAATAKSAAKRAKEAVRETVAFVRRHSKGVLIVIGVGAAAIILLGGISSLSSMFGSSAGTMFTTSYLSEDADMLAAEAAYAEMEAELQRELDNYAALHPGYDEYVFDLDSIEHDPYVLISILSAFHDGEFTVGEVRAEMRRLFERQYILTEDVRRETRYRTETRTDDEGNEYEVEVSYTYTVCTVKLENFNLSHIPVYIMDEDQLSLYAGYMSTLGNREDLFAGYPNASSLRQPMYYDIPPEALGDVGFAAMMEEATKYIGYPYVWGGSSPRTSFDCSGYVSWVINHSGWNVGRLGAQGLYNICTPVSASQARPGDLVFFVGTYDTTGCSHVGIYVGDNKMLHCGNPISYADLTTNYWQAHFYSFGRLP